MVFFHSSTGNGCPKRAAFARWKWVAPVLLMLLACSACKKTSYPKPLAYPRIDYPEGRYQKYENAESPVTFEYPSYAALIDKHQVNKNWMNLRFEKYAATLYLSFSEVPLAKLKTQLVEKENLAYEQAPEASDVKKEEFEAADHQFVGYFYLTDGNTPSPIQFLLSDRNGKLFQGSLLFDVTVNRDSLENVVDGITKDVRHLVETFRFKY